MDEQLLKLNGLSLGILDALSYESKLGIPLKKNLHYFDKDALMQELLEMTKWLFTQEALSEVALDYRIKSTDSIIKKYNRYYPDHQTRKILRRCWEMCYLIAKDSEGHGCYALKTKLGQHLADMKSELDDAVGFKGVQIVAISRPTAYGEYAPYHFVDTEQEFMDLVKAMRP